MRNHVSMWLLAVLTCCMTINLMTQETPTRVTDQNRTGELPFSTSIGTAIEHVDVATAALNVRIPIVSVPGRGMNSEVYIRFNSNYLVSAPRLDINGSGYYKWWPEVYSGWQLNKATSTSTRQTVHCVNLPSGYNAYYVQNFIYSDADGGKHPIVGQTATGQCAGPGDAHGPDLSGEGMWGGPYSNVLLADGSNADGYGGVEDANGNQRNSLQDTLGRSLYSGPTTINQGETVDTFVVKDANGNPQTYTLNWTTVPINTNFQAISLGNGGIRELSSTQYVISSIVLPNGQSYRFQYEPAYGEISRIDLPTGGYVTYTYATKLDGIKTRRYVSSRAEYVNGRTAAWTFSLSSSGVNVSTVTDPFNNQTVYSTFAGAVTSAKMYAGTAGGTPLRQYQIDYNEDSDPWVDPTNSGDIFPAPDAQDVAIRPVRITTTLENGLTQKKEFDYETFTYTYHPQHDGSLIDASTAQTYTTSRGNVTEIREWDWMTAGGTWPNPIRHTDKTYLHNANSAYFNANIVNKVLSDTVYNSAGAQTAQTQFEYDSTPITGTSQAPNHDYTSYSSSNTIRGNATRVKKWRNTDNALLATAYIYDDLGNIRQITDPRSNTTTWDYTDHWWGGSANCLPATNSQAYVTQVTNALNQIVALFDRRACTGQVNSQRDQNDINANRDGTTFTYDLMNRVKSKNSPDGGTSSYDYNDTPSPVSTQVSTLLATGGPSIVNTTLFDDLGRPVQTQLNSDSEGAVYVDTTYDAMGRTATVSNPYRIGDAPPYSTTRGLTQYAYDALGRTTVVTKADFSFVSTAYDGNTVTVTDEASNPRKSTSDALGRLTAIVEPNPSTGSLSSGAFNTNYSYDVLGNLLSVNQQGDGTGTARNRSFSYDSLSRLTSASNPESGTQNYTYDANGNVQTKTDARGIGTTYYYDALNRLGQKSFNDGNPACPDTGGRTPFYSYVYDLTSIWGVSTGSSIGRLSYIQRNNPCTGAYSSVDIFGYDAMGRVNHQFGRTPSLVSSGSGNTYDVTATYSLAGDMTALTYPSGRKVTYAYNSANRNTGVAFDSFGGVGNGYQYLSVPFHFANGAGYVSNYGNGITETSPLNNRLQAKQLTVNNSLLGTFSDLAYSYNDGHNNGNVYSIADQINPNRTQNFTYDTLNRLLSAQTSGPQWGNDYVIDPWGNLTDKNQMTSKTSGEFLHAPASDSNRLALTGYSYDFSGNLINDVTHTYQFDAENQVSTVDGTAAIYTPGPDGQRVRKQAGGISTEYIRFNGETLSEWNGASDWSDYIYAGGKRIARADNYEDQLVTQGSSCSSCATYFRLRNGAGYLLSGYVIHSGDKLLVRQWQSSGVHGGVGLDFASGGTYTNTLTLGNMASDPNSNQWDYRSFGLSTVAGNTISSAWLTTQSTPASGGWNINYQDFVLLSYDGTVHKLYSHDQSANLEIAGTTGPTYSVTHVPNLGNVTGQTTTFYHGDHLGSSRLLSNANGYPTWQGTYYPYGMEYTPPASTDNLATVNNYKFTGKERDGESGLDYFGARYLSSITSRWLTPDWSASPEPVPYANLKDPQTLNLFAYVKNNPVSRIDPDGHCDIGKEHHWGWCIWHTLGFYQTKDEQIASARWYEREFYKQTNTPGNRQPKLTDDQVVNAYRNGVFSPLSNGDKTDILVMLMGMTAYYRGGSTLQATSKDVKINEETGLVQPGRGVSINTEPGGLDKFGGAYKINSGSIPPELEIIQRGGNPNHYEIAPREPMTPARYQELLSQIKIER